jgi:hypothetical protein
MAIPFLSRTVRLNARYTVILILSGDGFRCEWEPEVPGPGELGPAEQRLYRDARDTLLRDAGERMPRSVANP